MFFHPSMLILIPGMILVWWAQQRVQGTYEKYSQVQSTLGMTGAEVAQTILRKMGVNHVSVEPVGGVLSDHYDPSAKAVRLSEVVYGSRSLAAAAVAAHECGHVLQDVEGYQAMNLRAALVPVVNFGSNLGPILIMIGFALGALKGLGLGLLAVYIGLALFTSVLVFHLVTLPVEFDASSRALRLINEFGILQGEENKAARKVLNAAAFTYVATAMYAFLQILQYVLIIMGARRD
ncbi:MAG: flagellar biosynthesis protein FlgM [Alkalinema sp. CACIAM 70d]|nr:MAG: flagellar biosynthesis protein FlgM [Alkalinema sp. CACIAM 70d]